jgi:hypothetical protein
MKLSSLAGAAGLGLAAYIAAAPALADTPVFEFIYVEGQAVETFTVSDPPDVISSARSGPLQQSVLAVDAGTLNGQTYFYGNLVLFRRSNFNQSGFSINTSGNTALLTSASGPLADVLYSGAATNPQILPGVYSLTDDQSILGTQNPGTPGAQGTLDIVVPKTVIFTLSGAVNAVIDIDDYPREVQYGIRNGLEYLQTYPVEGTLNGKAYDFGDAYFYENGGFSTANGGIDFGGNSVYAYPSLFTGLLYAPTFTPGVYALGGGETLTITAPDGPPAPLPEAFFAGLSSAVPEPSAWALMLTGLGVLGALLRRGRAGLARPEAATSEV